MADGSPSASASLVPFSSVEQMVAAKLRAQDLFVQAWVTMKAAYQAASEAAPSGCRDLPYLRGGSQYDRTGVNFEGQLDKFEPYVRAQLDRSVWLHIMKVTRLDQLMDQQEREAFERALADDPPEANVENISATLSRLLADSDTIFKRGVANVFSSLDRRFRSHDGFKIGSRIVLSGALNALGTWNHYRKADEALFDVERAFYRLDGKEPPESRYSGGIVPLISEHTRGLTIKAGEVESDYFRARVFQNGNLHVWFKSKELVGRVNQLLADYYGATLGASPDAAEAKAQPSGRVARNLGWFPTPVHIAKRVLSEAGIHTPETCASTYPVLSVLEPSAGEGALALPAYKAGHDVVCVELQPTRAAALQEAGLPVRCRDFLTMRPTEFGRQFDRTIMNPPFDRGLDVEHVNHALQFLAPGGRLVAIMSAGTEFREDAKTTAFRREVLERRKGRFIDLPPGSFAPATNVNTALLVIGGRW